MAWREALRDFYSRIAARLQAAAVEAPGASWVAVRVAGLPCLLPLGQAGEIFPAAPLQALPYTRHWFLGVANLRGELFSVIDLAAYLQQCLRASSDARQPMPAPAPSRADAAPSPSTTGSPAELAVPAARAGWFVTLHPSLEVRSAFRVDGLEGLRAASDLGPDLHDMSPHQAPPTLAAWVSAVYADAGGTTWFVLDLHRIVSQPGFLHVHA